MPSQEAAILADFLLAPAALNNFLTLDEFTNILPRSQRENPAVKLLYRELQRLRNEDIEAVRSNIADEVKKSRPLKRECIRARRQDDHSAVAGLDPVALDMEEELSGYHQHRKQHTLQTVHAAMEDAAKSIETQVQEMEKDIQEALDEIQNAVGELSDLRYGTFPKTVGGGNIGEEVLTTLKRLEAACTHPAG
ncbi:uncharacterized protein EI97DRAFT_441624 [Westerdykella ornata]|uniref:Cnl2/NKP2 family protein-domain-containing protein n=1 Tax=Westerdykella ornata TaxID=318751 RepID=A0A6A6JMZ6_WESOR|nr:uncharacterized protein EI97DRAFT_441624 [Westerdykella ornata]KAF2277595.1 hypothetical protein EI97DRAFT_441624 [Westerdykella ornata]